jgi:FAD/FMN-containing dehydrogenase
VRASSDLRAALGDAAVRTGAEVSALDPGWHPANLDAGVIVSPKSTMETIEAVRICARHGVAIVPQGGRTGLVGGGISRPGEIILATSRMNRIERLDPIERVAVVEAGVTLEALQTAAATEGLEPGIDLAARGTATIGGMTSTNAGGIMAFRNGVMRHRILGLEAVLADGSVYNDLTRIVKNAAGYDLKHLFIGAEGTLGIVTRIAVKLDPLPRATATALFGLPSVAAAQDAIRIALTSEVGHLRAAEALWRSYLTLTATALQWSEPAIDRTQSIFLLLGLGGPSESELQRALERIFVDLAEIYPDATGVVATSLAQERMLWRLREDTGIIYRAYPAAPSFDVSVPLSEITSYVTRITAQLAALDARLAPFLFGHLADGNLHIVFNHAGPLPHAIAAAVENVLYRDLRALGGSFSAEHGVGSKRIHSLNATADKVKLSAMADVKRLLDPWGLFNPGKIFAES